MVTVTKGEGDFILFDKAFPAFYSAFTPPCVEAEVAALDFEKSMCKKG